MKNVKLLFFANKTFLAYLFKHGKLILIWHFCLLFVGVLQRLINIYAPKYFIDEITINKSLVHGMMWILLMYFIQIVASGRAHIFSYLEEKLILRAKNEAVKEVYYRFGQLYLSYFEDNEKMNIFERGVSYAETGGEAFFRMVIDCISVLISFFTITIVSVQFEWWLWMVLVAAFVIKLFLTSMSQKRNFEFYRSNTARNRIVQYYSDVLKQKGTFQESRIYNTTEYFLEKYCEGRVANHIIRKKFEIKAVFKYGITSQLISYLFTCLCYILIGIAMLKGDATLGDYTLFFAAISSLNSILEGVRAIIMTFSEQVLNVKNYEEFINESQNLYKKKTPVSGSRKIDSIDYIAFKNVLFTYNNQSSPAIDGISLTIEKGEKISVVGLNGAGKTTFIKLILGLYHPQSGNIFINGINIDDLDFLDYWNKVGVVFQDFNVYLISLRDNIAFDKDISDDVIEQSFKRVGLDKKIKELPQEKDTMVSQALYENGVDFSGGERQRIAIARAFAKDAQLYIFDEPSSALDAVAEEQLYRIIQSIPEDRTVIFISHRLSSVSSTNRILLFNEGHLIGDGNHKDLLNECSIYRDLYKTQLSRYGMTI